MYNQMKKLLILCFSVFDQRIHSRLLDPEPTVLRKLHLWTFTTDLRLTPWPCALATAVWIRYRPPTATPYPTSMALTFPTNPPAPASPCQLAGKQAAHRKTCPWPQDPADTTAQSQAFTWTDSLLSSCKAVVIFPLMPLGSLVQARTAQKGDGTPASCTVFLHGCSSLGVCDTTDCWRIRLKRFMHCFVDIYKKDLAVCQKLIM